MVALVGGAEDPEVARLRLETKQVDEVERALLGGHVAAREPHLPALLLHGVDRSARALSFVEVLEELLETAQQRGPGLGRFLLERVGGR
jgi:hypothetical protein